MTQLACFAGSSGPAEGKGAATRIDPLPHRRRKLRFKGAIKLAKSGIAVTARIGRDILVPDDQQGDVLALQLPMNRRPIRLAMKAVAPLASAIGVERRLQSLALGSGQTRPALSIRFNVSRTVAGAKPSRRAISRVATLAENFNRMISRTWRIATLSAGIDRSLGLPKKRP